MLGLAAIDSPAGVYHVYLLFTIRPLIRGRAAAAAPFRAVTGLESGVQEPARSGHVVEHAVLELQRSKDRPPCHQPAQQSRLGRLHHEADSPSRPCQGKAMPRHLEHVEGRSAPRRDASLFPAWAREFNA